MQRQTDALQEDWAWHDVVRLHLASGAHHERCDTARRACAAIVPCREASLLQQSVARASQLAPDRVLAVVTKAITPLARRQLQAFDHSDVIAQPHDRGTAIGLLLALVELLVQMPDALVLVTPSDQTCADLTALSETVASAFQQVAQRPETLLAVACRASRPSSSSRGWLDVEPATEGGDGLRVLRVVAEPTAPETRALWRRGALRPTGMLVSSGRRLLSLFQRAAPALLRMFLYQHDLPAPERTNYLGDCYRDLEPVDLYSELLTHEAELRAIVLPAAAGWTDLGARSGRASEPPGSGRDTSRAGRSGRRRPSRVPAH